MSCTRSSRWFAFLVVAGALGAGCSCGESVTPPILDGSADVPVRADAPAADGTASGCGDGVNDRDEECDDGNTVGGDGCSADCLSTEICGNSYLDDALGETCDDGNTVDGDTCRGDCMSDYSCGNDVVDTIASGATVDEACDDGNTVNGDGCNASCDSDESCGNSIVDTAAGEVCDDGNTTGGDDCSADCMTSLLCGNGALDGVEECDDGGTVSGDGCSADCFNERCGNGRLDGAEVCDDGNTTAGDGCENDCSFTCSADADCADGDTCNGTETCTNGGTATSACAVAASPAPDGTTCGTGQICLSGGCVTSACGDGFLAAGEACDDGNTAGDDGCENDCTFTCSAAGDCSDGDVCNGAETCTSPGSTASRCAAGTPAANGTACGGGRICNAGVCTGAGCGDGLVTGTEQCDDSNTTSGDGCDSDCTWTCSAAADCSDGNACNGAETCTGGGTIASRCGAGTPPANGTTCGSGVICVTGACVAIRCGDSLVSAGEQCDDGNTANGDGCDNDCQFTCNGAADCADTNTCNGAEVCTMMGTLMSRCGAGTPPANGTACDRDGMPATRDICRTGACVASTCGDGFIDMMSTPAEQCDDGNTMAGDGCSATCQLEAAVTPTAFRITNIDLISPRVMINVLGCRDVTQTAFVGFSVNGELDAAVGADYSLHIVNVFRPLMPSAATTPTELHFNPTCMAAPTPDSCAPAAMPDTILSNANNTTVGTCFAPVASEVGPYTPTANTVSGPCFVSDEEMLNVTLAGIVIPLQRARVAATYMPGTSPTRLVTGVVTGFLSSTAAADVILPASLPVVGNTPLYTHLNAGTRTATNSMGATVNDACGSTDDSDVVGGVRGFWFFLNFTADRITWTGP